MDCKSNSMKKKRGTSSRMSDGNDITRFNALRFLAENLKAQNMDAGIPPRTAISNTPPSTSAGKKL